MISAQCGDGIKAGSEACDDSNTAAGDGCSATCTVEQYYNCTTSGTNPSVCTGEQSACVEYHLSSNGLKLGRAVRCGDGFRVLSEGCDDANTVNNDGCNSTCGVEPGWTCQGGSGSARDYCYRM